MARGPSAGADDWPAKQPLDYRWSMKALLLAMDR
jgi:hypothetical protein